MKATTIDQLEQLIDDSMAWRKIELQSIKSHLDTAERNNPGAPWTRALARAGVALLYAHWEGFVKESMQGYVDFVARRKLRYKELNDGFLRTSLMALYKRLSAGHPDAQNALRELVRDPDNSRALVPKNSMADTKSNLRAQVLADLLEEVGFPGDKFEMKANLIDRSLCDARNSIAHGKFHYPKSGEFIELHSEVLVMMEEIRDMIVGAARLKSYRHLNGSRTAS